jgi:DNA (cytosine-5)-methyltransferase 1
MENIRFIDLFAGIGGTRIGFEQAGAQCVFSSERDRFAQRTYATNFGEIPAGDIGDIDASKIPDHDILLAGFPCQPFSLAGIPVHKYLETQGGFGNPDQGNMFFETMRILDRHEPDAFLLENVKNLESHDKKKTFAIITETLRSRGYHFVHKIIDAADFVPQHRERIYIVGFKNPAAFAKFKWPDITPPAPPPRMSDILEASVDRKYVVPEGTWLSLQRHAERHRLLGNGFGYGIAKRDGISRTLTARYYKDGAEILIQRPGPGRPRRLTPRECARLMGFPEEFEIPVSNTQAYRQFGNSVVVPVIREIALMMMKALVGRKPRVKSWKPTNQFPLEI